jgi:hypothetical protein
MLIYLALGRTPLHENQPVAKASTYTRQHNTERLRYIQSTNIEKLIEISRYACRENRSIYIYMHRSHVWTDTYRYISIGRDRYISIALYRYISIRTYQCISIDTYRFISIDLYRCILINISMYLNWYVSIHLDMNISICIYLTRSRRSYRTARSDAGNVKKNSARKLYWPSWERPGLLPVPKEFH